MKHQYFYSDSVLFGGFHIWAYPKGEKYLVLREDRSLKFLFSTIFPEIVVFYISLTYNFATIAKVAAWLGSQEINNVIS